MEYKHGFILRIASKAITMRQAKYGNHESREIVRHFSNRFEEIRFDLRKQETTFAILTGSHRVAIKKYEIGNPFDCSLYEDSLLRHIRSGNMSEQSRVGVTAFLKTIRNSLRRKWKAIHGYDLGSIFVSYGQMHGYVLFPIMNFAFRIRHADAPNLSQELNGGKPDVDSFMTSKMMNENSVAQYMQLPRKRDSVTAVIESFGLPDKPMVRKLLAEQFFAAPELAALFKVTMNLDCAVQIWNQLRELMKNGYSWSVTGHRHPADIYPVLQKLAAHYPIRSIISLLKHKDWNYIRDIGSMLNRLVEQRLEDAWKVKLKHLHDWLTEALREQRAKGFDIAPSDVIKRRLAMQVDSLKFFLPEHTKDLDKASQTLRNCVHTYGEQVKEGICNIVLMTDDRGKLVACLEIRNGGLYQAKLKCNKQVNEDAKINAAVVDWCKKAHIEIRTPDVQQHIEIQCDLVPQRQTERVA